MANVGHIMAILEDYNREQEPRERTTHFDAPPRLFLSRYGFSKEGVRRIIDVIGPHLQTEHDNNRGRPFTAEQIVCSGLHILRGAHYQRVEGECANNSQSSAFKNLYRFVDALNKVKAEYVHMPTEAEMVQNSKKIEDKYGFPNVIMGIDGTHCGFDGAPRGIPTTMDKARHGRYMIWS